MIFDCRWVVLATFMLYGTLHAQAPIRYNLDLKDIARHELHISMVFEGLPRQTLEVRMPRSSPGRYAIHEFAKNVYAVAAFDEEGEPLPLSRTSPHQWEVAGHEGFVRFSYTLFGNRADGTYTGIDRRKVHMNMPATFAYGVGFDQRPVELHIDLSQHPNWTVATQLQPLDAHTFRAPDYYYFYDSPTIVGTLDHRAWTVADDSVSYTIEIAMDHDGTDQQLDAYTEWVKRVVSTERDIFGAYPAFDYGRYTFLCAYNPSAAGDGMEHRNSTICSSTASLERSAKGLISTVAHEFIHAWNVERLRPQSLEPFNYDDANMSGELWFAEGFTSYYTPLVLRRAGIFTEEDYLRSIQGLIAAVENAPGHLYHSPIQMSYRAPFVDAAAFNDPTNFRNTFISYYTYGAYIGLALDLSLRGRYGISLDDYMARLWREYGQPEIPYVIADLERVLGEVCGDPVFAQTFFKNHIYDSQLPDMKALLAPFGIELGPDRPGTAGFPSLRIAYEEEGATLLENPSRLHPFYQAGLLEGDRIVELNGTPMLSEEDWKQQLEEMEIGRSYPLAFYRDGQRMEASFTAIQDPDLRVRLSEEAQNGEARRLREAWLHLDP